jgi:hypothetical protein
VKGNSQNTKAKKASTTKEDREEQQEQQENNSNNNNKEDYYYYLMQNLRHNSRHERNHEKELRLFAWLCFFLGVAMAKSRILHCEGGTLPCVVWCFPCRAQCLS